MAFKNLFWKALLPFFVMLIVAGVCSSCSYWHRPSIIYLVPEEYEGMIVIAWDQNAGMPNLMEGGYEVYIIPQTGFIRTQAHSRNLAPLEEKFYSYNMKTGKRTELEIINRSLITDTITKINQFYQLKGFSGGNEEGKYMVMYLTKDPDCKFLDFSNHAKYGEKIDFLFKNY